MKTLRRALIFAAVAGLTNGLIAVTETKVTKKHVTPKHAIHQVTHKKHTPTKIHHYGIASKATTPKQAAHHVTHKKHTPTEAHHRIATKATTPQAAPVNAQANTAAAPTTESTASKISNWLGFGAASTAATTTAAAAGHVVHHRGPENFDKRHIPHDWKEGFTGKWVGNKWLFAGRDLPWWHANYPAYYRDVIRPEATRAGVPRQHFAHEHLTKRK